MLRHSSAFPPRLLLPAVCLWAGFLTYSLCHAPIPGVNEPHYLTKARHYWNPEWCPGDFFLESSNAHLVFYQTAGLLADVMDFEAAAFLGRVLAYLLLAVVWLRLCWKLTGDRWSGCIAASIFLLITSIGNFSGEWLVGGVEAKVFSYGFALAGTAALLSESSVGRAASPGVSTDGNGSAWPAAGSLLGLAVAFHPLVGLWMVIALSMAAAWAFLAKWRSSSWRNAARALRTIVVRPACGAGCALFVLLSMFGIVPALQSVVGADPRLAFKANYIQVFYRLSHHLDPMDFRPMAYVSYAGMSVLAAVLHAQFRSQPAWRFFSRMVACAGVIAVTGVLIGLGPRPAPEMPLYGLRMNLLKFYPFRLFDVVLPVLVAIQLAGLLSERRLLSVIVPRGFRPGLSATCFVLALWLNAGHGSVNRLTATQETDWLNACAWLEKNSPKDALALTPRSSWAFKWFAQRAEFVAFKDCPQDPAGIVEWNDRLRYLRKWGQENWNGRYYPADVTRELHEETGITHIVSRRFGPFEAPVVYRNGTYRIYRID